MRLTLDEKKIVRILAQHGIDLVDADMVKYPKGKKREGRKKAKKLLESIIVKINKDIEEEK